MRLAINSRETALSGFISRCSMADVPEDIQAAMRVYSVVQVCGYIERSIEVVILDRLQHRAHPKLLEFVKSHFKKGTNFRCSVIKSFIERFDTGWARMFQDYMDDNEDLVELINSAYTLRNQAAHGNSINLGQARLSEIFEAAKKTVQALITATN